LKVVFDTNIFISAFAIPGGKAEQAFLQALKGAFTLYTSISILTETSQILREKFDWDDERIIQLLKFIKTVAVILKTEPTLHTLKDEPNNRILECAEEGKVDLIVTGDKHILGLRDYKGIRIVNLSDFLTLLNKLA